MLFINEDPGLDHIINDTCAMHSGFVYDTDPDCQAQNGSTHSSVCLQLSKKKLIYLF